MPNRHQKRRANRKAKKNAEKVTAQRIKNAAEPSAPRLTHLQRFIRDKLQLETDPFEVDIGIQGTTLPAKQCHPNCQKISSRVSYMEARTCWILHDHTAINGTLAYLLEAGLLSQDQYDNHPRARQNDYEAEFHSILRDTRTGRWFDPTKNMLPSCTRRTVILEPRLSSADWLKYSRQAPENICTNEWGVRSTPAQEQPDFFNLVARVNMMKRVTSVPTILRQAAYF